MPDDAPDAPAARRDTNQALFARILDLRHWTSNSAGADKRHDCKCEDCKAIKQIVHLARQAVATSQSKRAKQLEELTARAVRAEGERDAYRQALRVQCEGNDHRLSDYLRGANVDTSDCASYSDQLKLVARTALKERRVIMCDDASRAAGP